MPWRTSSRSLEDEEAAEVTDDPAEQLADILDEMEPDETADLFRVTRDE